MKRNATDVIAAKARLHEMPEDRARLENYLDVIRAYLIDSGWQQERFGKWSKPTGGRFAKRYHKSTALEIQMRLDQETDHAL